MLKRANAIFWVLVLVGIYGNGQADELRFESAAAWAVWEMPTDLVQVGADGVLRLRKFRKEINALANAEDFRHPTQERGAVTGGIWEAKSSPETADFLLDGDPETFWRPIPDAVVTNSFGFRGRTEPVPGDDPERIRIAFIGDSCTFLGNPVYPELIQLALQRL